MPDFVQTFLGKLRKLEKKPDKIVFVRYCIALATVFPLLAVISIVGMQNNSNVIERKNQYLLRFRSDV
uniref:Uncharacterized protein n=1 Tax=Glossina palpalis gambiensis TaxID=67801 RepID=A0A1B0BG16_9MUSC